MAAAVPTPSPMPTQAAPNSFLALALCDFPSGSDAPTVLRMGEQLNVLSEDGEWWLVASKVSGKECLIPSSCVAKVWHRWLYEGISREKAEELLLRPGNHSGSFLIRQSQTRKGECTAPQRVLKGEGRGVQDPQPQAKRVFDQTGGTGSAAGLGQGGHGDSSIACRTKPIA